MTRPTKKYVMRSYVVYDERGLPIKLCYVVADQTTGDIVNYGLNVIEAERIRDKANLHPQIMERATRKASPMWQAGSGKSSRNVSGVAGSVAQSQPQADKSQVERTL